MLEHVQAQGIQADPMALGRPQKIRARAPPSALLLAPQ
jgi:hypothetical protein